MASETIKLTEEFSITAECSREILTTTNIDGCEYEIAPKTEESFYVKVLHLGKTIASSYTFSDRIEHVQFSSTSLPKVQALFERVIKKATTKEWLTLKAAEEAKKNKSPIEFSRAFGWCVECQSYCFGDCEINKC